MGNMNDAACAPPTGIIFRLATSGNRVCSITFKENEKEAILCWDRPASYHLLFLLKGCITFKTPQEDIEVVTGELIVVHCSLSFKGLITKSSRFVILDYEDPALFPFIPDNGALRKYTIPMELRRFLNYSAATMPWNMMMEHHSIPNVMRVIMKRCYPTTNSQ